MFTGIVQGTASVRILADKGSLRTLALHFPSGHTDGLQIGASVAVAGVCLTVVSTDGDIATFDVIDETLARTTLGSLTDGALVNFERAARYGDEIGGHLLSGHILATGSVRTRRDTPENCMLVIDVPDAVRRFVIEKGYIGVDGCSLTIGVVDAEGFAIHLIPETLRITTFSEKAVGDSVNIEVDALTQATVETVERVLRARASRA